MAENSKIQWTTHTFNPWRGCTKVATGCKNCYAETMSKRNQKTLGIWGPNGTRVVASEATWREPLKWDKAAGKAKRDHGELLTEKDLAAGPVFRRDRVFCASLADVFEEWSGIVRDSHGLPLHRTRQGSGEPEWWEAIASLYIGKSVIRLDDVRARLVKLWDSTPNLDWLVLTKRPENIRRMLHDHWTEKVAEHVSQNDGDGRRWKKRENVWLGTSIACQEDADRNIPELLKCRDLAAKLFLSIEPLVEHVDLCKISGPEGRERGLYASALHADHDDRFYRCPGAPVDWVIVGGESGSKARPCHIAWIRDLVRQCAVAEVPCFVKQLGSNPVCTYEERGKALGCETNGLPDHVRYEEDEYPVSDKKGGELSEWPEDLRVRQVPDSRGNQRTRGGA